MTCDMGILQLYIVLFFIFNIKYAFSFGNYFVTLTCKPSCDEPVVLGGNITFRADLFNDYGQRPTGTFKYSWEDNAIPSHSFKIEGVPDTTVYWNVSYSPDLYPPGLYEAEVTVFEHEFIYYVVLTSQRTVYNVTDMLNGKVKIQQVDQTESNVFVSNASAVIHTISLTPPDQEYLNMHATNVLTYWFVDCVYYGYSTDYSFSFNYTEMRNYSLEALVVASYEAPSTTPAPTTAPTTVTPTTPSPSNTTTTPSPGANTTTTTTSAPTSTTPTPNVTINAPSTLPSSVAPPSSTTPSVPKLTKYGTINDTTEKVLPFICSNSTVIAPDPNKTYGYFRKEINVKAPVANVNVNTNNWLQFGDVFYLNITCSGSPNFHHCAKIKPGYYNVTGNETCASSLDAEECQFSLRHYFRESATYTIVTIISNEVSKKVLPTVIMMYKVTKQPQLSVIVVPVTFSLLAVILIVFGFAYYIQSQNRYTVEVADFDFGQGNDMEYKTFYERLREDLSNMFNRSGELGEHVGVSPQRRKYDNMEES